MRGGEARPGRVAELRLAYLSGTLDLSIDEDGPGMTRLLQDLERPPTADAPAVPAPRRSTAR